MIFITFMFLQLLSGESSRQPDASLDLTSEAVRDGMQNWLDSVANMRIEWTSFNHEEVKAELPNLTETELEGYYFRQSFLWDKSGSFRREIFMYEKETLVYHQVLGVSGDNQLAFTVDFKCESGIPKQNKFTIKPLQQSADNNAVLPLRGWMSSHGKYWLAERAQLPKILKLDESGLVVFDQEVVRYFLDPQYSYLPARVEFRSSSSDSEPISVFKVEAFEKTPSGTPYPLNGTESIEKSGTAHWRTTKFTINEVLTSNAFEPPPPDKGVMIEDKISNKNYLADFSQWDRILEIAQRSRSNAPDRSYENTGLQARTVTWWISRSVLLLFIIVITTKAVCGVMARRVMK